MSKKSSLKTHHNNRSSSFIQLSIVTIIILLSISLPLLISRVSNPRITLDDRSRASSTEVTGPFQSWLVSPNGGEIVTGNIEVQFYAKDSANSNTKFSYSVDLFRNGQFVKNLFSAGIDQELANRNGIRSKFIDFTGIAEGRDYKLKLTTTNSSGDKVVTDFSDNNFTISSNSSKPKFLSTPPSGSLLVGQTFTYDVKATGSQNVRIAASVLPAWLTFSNNKVSGKPTTEGIYSVSLTATDDLNRQAIQVFSINVIKQSVTPTPSRKITPTPTPTVQPTSIDNSSVITVALPQGDNLSLSDSKVESKLPTTLLSVLKKITVEISKDATLWQKVYEGIETSFNLDIDKFDGGDYHLRFTYEYNDGKKDVKNYGPIHIIRQNSDPEAFDISFKDIKPQDGENVIDKRQVISSSFKKSAEANIDVKKFKLEINGQAIANDSKNLKLDANGFSYTPDSDWAYGKHTLSVTVALEKANPISKSWTFEVKNPTVIIRDPSFWQKNKWLIILIVTMISLLLGLSLWGFSLIKRNKAFVQSKDTAEDIGQSPLK